MTSSLLRPKVTGFAARLALGVVLALALFAATAAAWTLARARGA